VPIPTGAAFSVPGSQGVQARGVRGVVEQVFAQPGCGGYS
jgi:hypothetical protein